MKANCIIAIILLASILCSCQQSAAPSTNAQLTPTTAETNSPTESTVPVPKTTVTPINTYVKAWNPDGTANYDNRVGLNTDNTHPDLTNILLGEVVLSENILRAIRDNPGNAVFYVAVSYAPTLGLGFGEQPNVEQYKDLRQKIRDRYDDAGYYTVDGGAYAEKNCFFYLLASAEQLQSMNCGDDLAIYIYVPRYAY